MQNMNSMNTETHFASLIYLFPTACTNYQQQLARIRTYVLKFNGISWYFVKSTELCFIHNCTNIYLKSVRFWKLKAKLKSEISKNSVWPIAKVVSILDTSMHFVFLAWTNVNRSGLGAICCRPRRFQHLSRGLQSACLLQSGSNSLDIFIHIYLLYIVNECWQ